VDMVVSIHTADTDDFLKTGILLCGLAGNPRKESRKEERSAGP